jgi:hypothetical protein
MTIANHACCGYQACYDAVDTTIGMKSCHGIFSCLRAVRLTIARSCRGIKACYEAESTTILAGSCIGDCVCEYMIGSVVGTLSCIGDSACDVYGYSADHHHCRK